MMVFSDVLAHDLTYSLHCSCYFPCNISRPMKRLFGDYGIIRGLSTISAIR